MKKTRDFSPRMNLLQFKVLLVRYLRQIVTNPWFIVPLVLQPVVACISGGVVVDVLPVFPVDERPPTLVASVPGAQSGHLVVGRPVFHRNDGGVEHYYAAPVGNILFEGFAHGLFPSGSPIVDDYQVIAFEIGFEAVDVFSEIGCYQHVNLKKPAVFQYFFNALAGSFPIMAAVLSGDEQGFDGLGGIECGR